MKINTMLAIALLIAGSSLYAEAFRGHGPVYKHHKHNGECRECERNNPKTHTRR